MSGENLFTIAYLYYNVGPCFGIMQVVINVLTIVCKMINNLQLVLYLSGSSKQF